MKYLQHVTARYDLRKHMYFEQALTEARWDDNSAEWVVQTSKGVTFRVRYLVTSLGLLSKQNYPDIAGLNDYKGEKYHTGAWPQGVSLQRKRVGIIGSGSTGVQVITEIAKDVDRLVSFQRNPQYSVPSGQRLVSDTDRKEVYDRYEELWHEAKDESLFGFGFKEVSRSTFSVGEDERKEIYETAWRKGGGFRFMFETFGDITVDEEANKAACEFMKNKIRETVRDQEKARKLMPTQLYARRPLCDAGYYEALDRDNVDVVNLKETPIQRLTPQGILTYDGTEHELDVIIFATGFDAVDGNYTRIAIHGRNGESLKDHWSTAGPTSYLGISIPGFPNMFCITGPNGPFSNIPPAIETHVEFITSIIETAESTASTKSATVDKRRGETQTKPVAVESSQVAEDRWTKLCDDLSVGSLFRSTHSWIFGSNVPGKKHSVLFYFGGLTNYRAELRRIVDAGFEGFTFS